jgi:hypothetical protein
MQRAVLIILLLMAAAAQPVRATDDKAAIRATIADYIEGYYLSDAARMERSLHPHYLKHTISGSNGELNIADKSGMEMVQEVRNKKAVTLCRTARKRLPSSISPVMSPRRNWSQLTGPIT